MDDGVLHKETKGTTFRQFASGFFSPEDPQGFRNLTSKRGRKLTEDYYKAMEDIVDKYLIPRFGDYLISSITDVMVEDYILNLIGVSGKELADGSKNKVLICMRYIMQEAKRKKYIMVNPAAEVEQITERHMARKPFNGQEITLMFPKDDGELLILWGGLMWSTYFLVMRDTGFRPGEVAGLSRECYLPRLHGIYTMQSVNSRHELRHRIKTTGKGFPYKVGVLTEQTDRFVCKLVESSKTNQLFLLRHRLVGTDAANKHLRGVLDKLGIPCNGRSQYSFRHSFETDLSGNVEDVILKELMAHNGYHPEYDHRTPETLLRQLQPVRKILEERGKDDQNVH